MTDHVKITRGMPRVQYTADGSQRIFIYPFPIFSSEDLEIFIGAARQLTGFIVSGAGNSAGGQVTFSTAPMAGLLITLRRQVFIERVTDFLESGPLSAASLNTELDRLTACLQQVSADQELMLHYAADDFPATAELPNRAARSNRLLSFDSSGNPTATLPGNLDTQIYYLPQGSGGAQRPIREKLGDIVSVKDFGAVGDGVSDDATAIQSALTAFGSVYVPAGIYCIANTITLGYGQTLFGEGQTSILRATPDATFDAVLLTDGYATLRNLRIEGGQAGVRLRGQTGPSVQNALLDLTLWDQAYGLILDGYAQTERPCYWNNITRVLIARPSIHGVWMTCSGAGDTPNANHFFAVRVYSLSAPISGSGFYIEHGRYNNTFIDCEANLSTTAHSCFRLGAHTNKNLLINLYTETLASIANVVIEAGSVETSIFNLFSASAGPAIQDFSGGQYTTFNAGYPTKNRLQATRISELTVESLRYDTEFYDPSEGGVFEPDLSSSVYLVSAYNGAIEVRLPNAGDVNGQAVTIKKTDASGHAVSITENDSVGPDGRTVVLGNRYDFVTVVSNGANWWIIAAAQFPENAYYFEGGSLFEPDLSQRLYMVSAWSDVVEVRLPLPSAPHAVGRTVTVKKSDQSGNAVTVTKQDGGGPDNQAIALTGYGHAVTVMSNGAGWQILNQHP
ncbi:Pectate_lyase_3 domain-containing protein [Azospirillaceae bacterium]